MMSHIRDEETKLLNSLENQYEGKLGYIEAELENLQECSQKLCGLKAAADQVGRKSLRVVISC